MKIAPRGRRVFGPDPVAGPPPPICCRILEKQITVKQQEWRRSWLTNSCPLWRLS